MKLVYFMRAKDRVGNVYSYQGSTSQLNYKNKMYFSFIISDDASEWIELQNETHMCYLKYNDLRVTLNKNGADGNSFINKKENDYVLDISDKSIELLQSHVSLEESA